MDTNDTPDAPDAHDRLRNPEIDDRLKNLGDPDTPETHDIPEIGQGRLADSHTMARRQRRNPNRRARRTASRLAVVTAMTVGAVATGATAASAMSNDSGGNAVGGEMQVWEMPGHPSATVRAHSAPAVRDYKGNVHIQGALPEGDEVPDGADPEPTHGDGEDAAGEDGHDLVMEDIRLSDPDDARVEPEVAVEDDGSCDDPDFVAQNPEECPDGELPGDEPAEDPCEPNVDTLTHVPEDSYVPEDCDEPGETTTTTVPPETTTTTVPPETTTTINGYPEPEVEQATAERKVESLAFTGSGLALPLVGAGLLGTGAVIAGLSIASRRRADAPGEA